MSSDARTDRALITWALLMVLTLASFAFGDGVGAEKPATIAVFVLAYLKINMIAHGFMGLDEAPRSLRLGFVAFTCATGTGLATMYLVA